MCHSIHAPSHTVDHKIPKLVLKIKRKLSCIVCYYRGPVAALRYIRERERLLGPGAKTKMENGVGWGR
jgi:Cdc25 family phosphatase